MPHWKQAVSAMSLLSTHVKVSRDVKVKFCLETLDDIPTCMMLRWPVAVYQEQIRLWTALSSVMCVVVMWSKGGMIVVLV
jgi:hypothetical protein